MAGLLDAADVPCAPILRRGEIIHNEQVIARGIIAEFDEPKVGRVQHFELGVKWTSMGCMILENRPSGNGVALKSRGASPIC